MWLVSSFVILLFGICFAISTVIITERSREDYEIREAEVLLSSMSGSVTASIESYKDLSRLVMLNENVTKFLRADEVDPGIVNDAHYGIMDVLNVSNDVDSVFVFRNDGEYMSTGRGLYHVYSNIIMDVPSWSEEIFSKKGGAIICMNGNDALFRTNGQQLITIARAIYDIYTQQQTGILMMNISTNMLEDICKAQSKEEVVIMNRARQYLAGDEAMYTDFSNNFDSVEIHHNVSGGPLSKRMISGVRVDGTPIIIMCATTASTEAIPKEVTITLIMLLTAFIISVGIAGSFIVKDVTRPILQLSDEISSTKDSGWLEHLQSPMPDNEIGHLAASYDNMIDHLNDMFTELREKEETVRKAEMRILHEQIKPHFLYNSLETISCMAVDAGAENVHSALETLGSFYRNFLSKGDREISLRREITIIKDYLTLQKMRYEDTITDVYEIEEEALGCKIPKLILQPLVENSINHGIRMKGEPGTILIKAYLEEGTLHLIVRDNGVGMSAEQIAEEMKPLEAGSGEEGFGLRGTIDRIRYYCGSDDVVNIESEPGEYTKIEIVIPKAVKTIGGN